MTRTQTELAELATWIATAAETAYMAEDYGREGFERVAKFLLQQGHTAQEAEAILKSKHMRWADDSQGRGIGKRTNAAAFKRYYATTTLPLGSDWIGEGRLLALDTLPSDLPDQLQGISMADDGEDESAQEKAYEIASADEVWTLTTQEADMIRTAITLAYEDADADLLSHMGITSEQVDALWKRFVAKS